MTLYPTQSCYLGTESTSPGPILILPSSWLASAISIFKVISLTRPGFELTRFRFSHLQKWGLDALFSWPSSMVRKEGKLLTMHHVTHLIVRARVYDKVQRKWNTRKMYMGWLEYNDYFWRVYTHIHYQNDSPSENPPQKITTRKLVHKHIF